MSLDKLTVPMEETEDHVKGNSIHFNYRLIGCRFIYKLLVYDLLYWDHDD